MNFLSDNAAPAHPHILQALSDVNSVDNHGYGEDGQTQALTQQLSALFETQVTVFPVVTGTAANALAMATLCPPHGAILCHRDAHLETDECGAPEFFTAGAKLRPIAGDAGKLTPETLQEALATYHDMVHMVVPHVLSITQSSELGRVYQPEEVKALVDVAKSRRLFCHMDGARFANAVAALGCRPAEITWKAGIDVLSFGATKNGALAAEAVVFFDPNLSRDFEFRRKRSGHLLSKLQYVSAQLSAFVRDGLWLELAAHANAAAAVVARGAGKRLAYPVEANEAFITLSDAQKAVLKAQGFDFYDWGSQTDTLARFVTSWATPLDHCEALAKALQTLDG
jgi:threonine aldolase